MASMNWKDGDAITVKIKRDGKEQIVKRKSSNAKRKQDGYQSTDATKKAVHEAWRLNLFEESHILILKLEFLKLNFAIDIALENPQKYLVF